MLTEREILEYLDGSERTRLTIDAAEDARAAWSPDGQQIVFDRRVETTHFEVFVMNADGTNQTRLTFSGPDGFSGFGSWGVGAALQPPTKPVWEAQLDGSAQTRLRRYAAPSESRS